MGMFGRFGLVGALALLMVVAGAAQARAEDAAWAALADGGHVVMMRHATAPGIGDPPGFRIDVCETQRNLSAAGREEAQAAGTRLRQRGIRIDRVLTSAWCRCRQTAEAMAVGTPEVEPALNSFFGGQGDGAAQTASARRLAAGWSGPGTLLLVTHQVNITALTGVFPASGEMVVLRPFGGDGVAVVGRIAPP